MIFTEVWNRGYDILVEEGVKALRVYLDGLVEAGEITHGDADVLVEDMVDTRDL